MTKDSKLDRQKKAFDKYFDENPKTEDVFGAQNFIHSFEELDKMAEEYRKWYKSTKDHSYINVPKEHYFCYKIHKNLSGENYDRANLLSKLTTRTLSEAITEILSVRSLDIPIDKFNGAAIYTSSIYRGKIQVNTGSEFERKITTFVNSIDEDIEIIPGRSHKDKSYDKDIMINGEYIFSIEIAFQVTTNSVIERKSNLDIPSELTVIMVLGGLGWIDRIAALERFENRYSECFGSSNDELERLKQYILSFK